MDMNGGESCLLFLWMNVSVPVFTIRDIHLGIGAWIGDIYNKAQQGWDKTKSPRLPHVYVSSNLFTLDGRLCI